MEAGDRRIQDNCPFGDASGTHFDGWKETRFPEAGSCAAFGCLIGPSTHSVPCRLLSSGCCGGMISPWSGAFVGLCAGRSHLGWNRHDQEACMKGTMVPPPPQNSGFSFGFHAISPDNLTFLKHRPSTGAGCAVLGVSPESGLEQIRQWLWLVHLVQRAGFRRSSFRVC